MPLDNPPGPVSQALLGKSSGAATPVASVQTPTNVPQTTPPPAASTSPSTTTPPSDQTPPPGGQVPDDFFSSSAGDLSKIAGNFQPASTESDFPQQFTAPPAPQTQKFDPIHAWGSAAMMIALVGSAFTKHPVTAALNAGAQVMNAFKQNVDASNTQAYNAWQTNVKNSFEMWKANAANAVQNHRYEMTYLSKIMSDQNMDNRTKATQIMEYARATKNYGLMQILATQGLQGAEDYMNKYSALGATLAGASNNVDTFYQENYPPPGAPKGMVQAPGGINVPSTSGGINVATPAESSPETSKAMESYVGNRYADWIPAYVLNGLDKRYMPQMSFAKGSDDQRVFDAGVTAFMSAYGIDPIQLSSRRATISALDGNIKRLSGQLAQAQASSGTFAQQWQYIQQNLMSKGGPPTNLGPVLNNYLQTGAIASGDANTVAYVTALGTLAEEYAKVISGSTGTAGSTVNAQEFARSLFQGGYSNAQITAAIKTAQANMAAREQQYPLLINQMNGFISSIPSDSTTTQTPTTSDDGGGDGGGDAAPPVAAPAPSGGTPTSAKSLTDSDYPGFTMTPVSQ